MSGVKRAERQSYVFGQRSRFHLVVMEDGTRRMVPGYSPHEHPKVDDALDAIIARQARRADR